MTAKAGCIAGSRLGASQRGSGQSDRLSVNPSRDGTSEPTIEISDNRGRVLVWPALLFADSDGGHVLKIAQLESALRKNINAFSRVCGPDDWEGHSPGAGVPATPEVPYQSYPMGGFGVDVSPPSGSNWLPPSQPSTAWAPPEPDPMWAAVGSVVIAALAYLSFSVAT